MKGEKRDAKEYSKCSVGRRGGVTCGHIGYPFLPSEAQKAQFQPESQATATPTPDQDELLKKVRWSSIVSDFVDTVSDKEPGWVLANMSYYQDERVNAATLVFNADIDAKVIVDIIEARTLDKAKSRFVTHLSRGEIVSCRGDGCGEQGIEMWEGRKASDTKEFVGFLGLVIREGVYVVTVECKSYETAKRIAGYALGAATKTEGRKLFPS
ncbi:MAG TPA: hypothetical protein PKC65_08120 [Pyrinomonadaceae bacterium]|nr:hypothetical protein [Pyrinomonadaceae bacterium]